MDDEDEIDEDEYLDDLINARIDEDREFYLKDYE